MLRQLDAVLFGDVADVFTHDDEGHEAHVDRTMNVIASGFMHSKFFDDMMSVHVHYTFDELPLDQQPSIARNACKKCQLIGGTAHTIPRPSWAVGLCQFGLSQSLSRDKPRAYEPLSVLAAAALPHRPWQQAEALYLDFNAHRWWTQGVATVRCCYDSSST